VHITDILHVAEEIAPVAASALGGPLAGGAVSALEKALQPEPAPLPQATPEDGTIYV
jgi:hypothetical protein